MFKNELINLINKYNKENMSNTPDFILEDFIMSCLSAYEETVQKRDSWYNFVPWNEEKEK